MCQSLVSRAVMASACRAGHLVVLEEWELLAQPRASAGSRPARPTPGRGGPGRRTRSRRPPSAERPVAAAQRPGRLEAGHPLVLLRRQPGLLPHQRAEPPAAVADLVGDLAAPRSPRVSPASARPPRPAASAAPLRASAAGERPRRPRASPLLQARAGQPLRQVGQVGSDVLELEQLPASSAAGTPSSARAPAVVSPSWMPRWVPSWWIAAGAACSPDTVDQRCSRRRAVAPSRRPAAPPRAARTSGSSSAAPGAPRARPGRRRTPPAR